MSMRACIIINSEFWTELEELRTALVEFSPGTKGTYKGDEESPNDKIEFLKRAINCLDTGRETFQKVSDLRASLTRVLDATDETHWLLQELRARTDDSAVGLRKILEDMKIMVLNPGERYYQFEYMSAPVFAKKAPQVHFLLAQLRDLFQ
jgi:hypothetical protein